MTNSSPHELPTRRVAAAIISRDGCVLAAERSHGAYKDHWEFPGGKLEPGETSEQACRRECQEELNVTLDVLWPFATVEYDYPDFHLVMDVFVAPLDHSQEPQLIVHKDMKWVSRMELGDLTWLEADAVLIASLGMSWDQIFDEIHL